jgi:16S rRNA (cytidine1402-2'-O)-methyltransferase
MAGRAAVGGGTLYIVSTPIGNLKDITLRALETLRSADLIACEDTRVTLKLLNRYEIKKPLLSFHAKSQQSVIERILRTIQDGARVVYVSDSGTPSVSDPGARLVQRILDEGGDVVPIPGPSAVHAALAASGIPYGEYIFLGFLSNKAARRRRTLSRLKEQESLIILYESPHRLLSFLHDVHDIFGDVHCIVAKEMTKKFEKYYRGSVAEVTDGVAGDGVKGEYTVILDNRNTK